MQRMQEGVERQTVWFRLLEADSGIPLREDPGCCKGGREDGLAQEGSQHGREEVVDVSERLEGYKWVTAGQRQ